MRLLHNKKAKIKRGLYNKRGKEKMQKKRTYMNMNYLWNKNGKMMRKELIPGLKY